MVLLELFGGLLLSPEESPLPERVSLTEILYHSYRYN